LIRTGFVSRRKHQPISRRSASSEFIRNRQFATQGVAIRRFNVGMSRWR
jgi:hypothetical protein